MKVRWTPQAFQDLKRISDYLFVHHLRLRVVKDIYDSAMSLRRHPWSGPLGSEPGTRELLSARYQNKIVYEVHSSAVHILHIRHPGADQPAPPPNVM